MFRKFYRIVICFQVLFCSVLVGNPAFQLPDSLQKQIRDVVDTQKINLLNNYAQILYFKDFEHTKNILDSSIIWSKAIGYKKGQAVASKILGQVYYIKGEYELASKAYITSLNLYEKLKNKSGQADVYNEMGNMMRQHGDNNTAEKYLLKAMQLCTEVNDLKGLATSNNNLGIVFETKGVLDSAMMHYQKALSIYIMVNDSIGMGYSYDYIGVIHAYRNEFAQSVYNLKRGLAIRELLHDRQSMAYSYVNLGEASLARGNTKDASGFFQKSLTIAQEMSSSNLISYNYKKLSEIAAKENNFKEAYTLQQKYAVINDSLFNLKRNEQIAEIQTRYETEKKEKENVLLLKRNNEKELHISQQRVQLSVLTGIMIILVMSAGLFYNRNKLRQQQILNDEIKNQERIRLRAIIESQEEERQRIAAELHDGLGQVLSAARVNIAALVDETQRQPQIYQALELIDRSCKELREISHNMMPSLLVNSGLYAALIEMSNRINSTGILKMEVLEDGFIERVKSEIEINLYRIAQELITNILKYANATEVQIQFILEKEMLTMMMEDNGQGFDVKILQKAKGNGWYNIQSRTRLINGQIEIDSKVGNGTVVTLNVPLDN